MIDSIILKMSANEKGGGKKGKAADKGGEKAEKKEGAAGTGTGGGKKGKGGKGAVVDDAAAGKGRTVSVLDEAAMENAYNICHNVQDLLYFRGFFWEGDNKKGKGKGRKKGKKSK